MAVYMFLFFSLIGTLLFHCFLKPPYYQKSRKELFDLNASRRELLTKSEAAKVNG
ncbi:hypothetical protein [Cytobacillus firmus]|uniref:hypothetical protein n=1 Tax=Cytobacillus firmus TaxID=1399 RepID=UPI001C8E9581|nr:hypothetical protein [Cytobacillus firmus]MBX9973125.1 hypothetical protein [Cytobacillus firmus]